MQEPNPAPLPTPTLIRIGLLAGLVGGVVMGMVAMIVGGFLQEGIDIWTPIRQVAAAVMGEGAMGSGFAAVPVAVGTLIHMIVSAVVGGAYAVVYDRVLRFPLSWGIPYLIGGVFGLGVWAVANLALPRVAPIMAQADKPAFLLGHVAFGIATSLTFLYLERMERSG